MLQRWLLIAVYTSIYRKYLHICVNEKFWKLIRASTLGFLSWHDYEKFSRVWKSSRIEGNENKNISLNFYGKDFSWEFFNLKLMWKALNFIETFSPRIFYKISLRLNNNIKNIYLSFSNKFSSLLTSKPINFISLPLAFISTPDEEKGNNSNLQNKNFHNFFNRS